MRLAIYSDLHVEFATFVPHVHLEADVVVLAGDIHSPGSSAVRWMARRSVFGGRHVIYVPGNHEYYGRELRAEELRMRKEADLARSAGLHLLQCDEVVLYGIRFLGCTLWTDFELCLPGEDGLLVPRTEESMRMCEMWLNDYELIRTVTKRAGCRLRTSDTLAIHRLHRTWLARKLEEPFAGPTVVVTHHAPSRGSLSARFADDPTSAAYVTELPEAFFEVARLWIHGHTHRGFDYRVRGCRVVCNPRGYPTPLRDGFENRAFDPSLIVEVD